MLPTPWALAGRAAHEAVNVGILARAGIVSPIRPDRLVRVGVAALRWGPSPAIGVAVGAARHPGRTMVVDDEGPLTYAEVDRRSSAVAAGLRVRGVREGDRIGLLCRDHRGFVETLTAAGKLGADVLLLNTSFAAPQLAEVCAREEARVLVHDREFTAIAERAGVDRVDEDALAVLAAGPAGPLPRPGRAGRVTILTSGTTGTPKGAPRGSDGIRTLDPATALLDRIPLRAGHTMRIAAPLFHGWGLGAFVIGTALGATMVLRRRFDPEQVLADLAAHRAEVLIAVPAMLLRILELPDEVRARHDVRLRATCLSGSALPAGLATRWMDAYGDTLFNMYGSTEVSVATLATPEDLRADPRTAGRPARGCVVRLLDEQGRPVPDGETGRVFVGNAMLFGGYTGGGDKERIGGLMATGDVGRFDTAGRLLVEGRDDEMIVSGGENVFPKEVEDCLASHPGVAEAAALGVEDERFGQRLRAFVVRATGSAVTAEELQAHVRDELARYKVPREVVFVDALPRNPTGKVLKRELREAT